MLGKSDPKDLKRKKKLYTPLEQPNQAQKFCACLDRKSHRVTPLSWREHFKKIKESSPRPQGVIKG